MIQIEKIESTPRSPNPFQVNVNVRGYGQVSGLLTREMLTGLDKRSVVLLPEESVAAFLPREEADALTNLRDIATSLDVKKLGRVGVFKEIVMGLFRKQRDYQMKCVLVHRYGPVPGVLIETNATSPVDPALPLFLGVYLNFHEERDTPAKRLGFSSINLLHCLEFFPQVLFQRYFEDVGAIFDSIGRADLSRTLWWSKWIETIIAQSVNSKLREVFPKSKQSSLQEALAQKRRDEHAYPFLQAAYAGSLCLHLVNVLYECLGIWSSDKYRGRLLDFRSDYERFFPPHIVASAFNSQPALSDLEKTFNAFEDGVRERSERFKVDLDSGEKWVNQVCEFARFVWLLRAHGTPDGLDSRRTFEPTIANIFISSHHAVPVSQVVRAQLMEKTNGGRDCEPEVQLLYVREPAGVPFLSVIKGRIWLSDGLFVVIPASTQKFNTTSADYDWIGEEALAARGLDKELLFVTQVHPTGTSHLPELRKKFEGVEGRIFEPTNLDALKRDLVDHLTNNVSQEFYVSDDGSVDEPLITAFKVFSRRAYNNRTNQLVRGFLRQLSDSVFYRLPALRQAGSGTPEYMMSHLMKNSRLSGLRRIRFSSLYDEARKRRLIINGVSQYLMVRAKANKRAATPRSSARYAWNLTEILHLLRPYASAIEIRTWEDSLMDWADREANRGDSSRRAA